MAPSPATRRHGQTGQMRSPHCQSDIQHDGSSDVQGTRRQFPPAGKQGRSSTPRPQLATASGSCSQQSPVRSGPPSTATEHERWRGQRRTVRLPAHTSARLPPMGSSGEGPQSTRRRPTRAAALNRGSPGGKRQTAEAVRATPIFALALGAAIMPKARDAWRRPPSASRPEAIAGRLFTDCGCCRTFHRPRRSPGLSLSAAPVF